MLYFWLVRLNRSCDRRSVAGFFHFQHFLQFEDCEVSFTPSTAGLRTPPSENFFKSLDCSEGLFNVGTAFTSRLFHPRAASWSCEPTSTPSRRAFFGGQASRPELLKEADGWPHARWNFSGFWRCYYCCNATLRLIPCSVGFGLKSKVDS